MHIPCLAGPRGTHLESKAINASVTLNSWVNPRDLYNLCCNLLALTSETLSEVSCVDNKADWYNRKTKVFLCK